MRDLFDSKHEDRVLVLQHSKIGWEITSVSKSAREQLACRAAESVHVPDFGTLSCHRGLLHAGFARSSPSNPSGSHFVLGGFDFRKNLELVTRNGLRYLRSDTSTPSPEHKVSDTYTTSGLRRLHGRPTSRVKRERSPRIRAEPLERTKSLRLTKRYATTKRAGQGRLSPQAVSQRSRFQ